MNTPTQEVANEKFIYRISFTELPFGDRSWCDLIDRARMSGKKSGIKMINLTYRDIAPPTIVFLVLLSGCSMFGGDPTDPMDKLREQVQAVVTDPGRAEMMLASVERVDLLLIESADLLAEAAQRERVLFVDFDSTPQDYEALFSETRRERRRLQQAILDAHLDIKAQATPDEWRVIRPAQADAVSAKIESLLLVALDQR